MKMTNRELVLETLKRSGKLIALTFQQNSGTMTGTEINAEMDYIPDFAAAKVKMNMIDRPVGFICKAPSGRIVRLIQAYDSNIFTQDPEELPAQWGFVWSKNPDHALPYVAISTSPYMVGDCCSEDGVIFKSLMDNNVHAPSAYPQGWEQVTE